MSKVLSELVELLALERIEENLFRGQSQDLGWGLVFGGQVLGQALSAAVQTVPSERHVHSLHAYFLRPGDAHKPIVYDVDRIRDGGSFTTRRIVAVQGGHPIFHMSASFQKSETGFEHQDEMRPVNGPDGIKSDLERWRELAPKLPPELKQRAVAERPIELRHVDPVDPFRPEKKEPREHVWVRAAGALPDDPALHCYLLAYCSDFSFVTTSLRPHGVTWAQRDMHVASLDHVMWFHRPFRVDQWLLHEMESPSASGSRGFARGRFFTHDGVLVASTAQEGLIRRRERS